MAVLEMFFERSVVERIKPWCTLSMLLFVVVGLPFYIAGHWEAGHAISMVLGAGDTLVIGSALWRYYTTGSP